MKQREYETGKQHEHQQCPDGFTAACSSGRKFISGEGTEGVHAELETACTPKCPDGFTATCLGVRKSISGKGTEGVHAELEWRKNK